MSTTGHVKSLRISPDTANGLTNADKILKNLDTITCLHIDLRTYVDTTTDRVTSGVIDVVPTTIFRYILAPEVGQSYLPPISQLNRLVLWNVNLSCSDRTWLRAIAVSSLTKLEIRDCVGSSVFLAAFHESGTRLKSFRFEYCRDLKMTEDNPRGLRDTQTVDTLEMFLSACKDQYYLSQKTNLTSLSIRLRNHYRLPDADVIASVCGSLQKLHLDVCDVRLHELGSQLK